jgi:hypothetical protein
MPTGRLSGRLSSPESSSEVCGSRLPENNSGDLKGGRRMYIGLGTVLLIVLIIILLIWVF